MFVDVGDTLQNLILGVSHSDKWIKTFLRYFIPYHYYKFYKIHLLKVLENAFFLSFMVS